MWAHKGSWAWAVNLMADTTAFCDAFAKVARRLLEMSDRMIAVGLGVRYRKKRRLVEKYRKRWAREGVLLS